MGTLKKCTDEGWAAKDSKLYKRCSDDLENLHHCYSWEEPTEKEPSFIADTEKCVLPRDIFVKCAFRQGEPFEVCFPKFIDIYRCMFTKDPKKYTIY